MTSRLVIRLNRSQFVLCLLAAAISLSIGSRSVAQIPSLDAYYDRIDPKTSFNYKLKGEEKVCDVGAFHWHIPPTEFGTGALDRNYTSYSAEVHVTMVAGKLYRFRPVNLLDPANYGLEETPEGIKAAERRTSLIRELFGRYYTQDKSSDPDRTFAMQVALQKLTHETEPPSAPATFDLFEGDFQANYTKIRAPAFVTLAQSYLDSLKGDDAIYYQNQELAGRELIRLKGIPNPDGDVAQSQYALRFITGGAPGIGPFANVLGNGNGAGLGGGMGGTGAGPGAGLGAGETSAGGGSIVTTGGSTPTTGTPTGGGGSSPPGGGTSRAPAGGGQTTPVPAPAGLLLGLVAVGAFATRRIYLRVIQK